MKEKIIEKNATKRYMQEIMPKSKNEQTSFLVTICGRSFMYLVGYFDATSHIDSFARLPV